MKTNRLLLTVSEGHIVSGNGQFLEQLVHVDSESCSWRWEGEKPWERERAKGFLVNEPLFTNTSKLMKACPYLLNYVCSFTQSTLAITHASGILRCVRVEEKRYILFFYLLFCTKHLMKRDYQKHVSLIVVMPLHVHNQCFKAAVCDNLCSFKWNKNCTVRT